jgi:hypothetical protein
MWRFLLSALTVTAALIVLFVGALGDLRSLSDLSDWAIAIIGSAEPRHVPPLAAAASPAASAVAFEQETARDALQHQIADLQRQVGDLENQIAQRSHEVETRRAETDGLRRSLETTRAETTTLRQQRQAEENVSARKALAKQMATANALRRPTAPRPASPPFPPTPIGPSAARQLLNAQQWLATGRPDEARQILVMVQPQMGLRPVTPGRPMAQGGNPSATDIGTAIRWLDIGANGQAMQAINRAISHANAGEAPPSPWVGYPGQPFGGYYANDGR